jgi:hypothetical protein
VVGDIRENREVTALAMVADTVLGGDENVILAAADGFEFPARVRPWR